MSNQKVKLTQSYLVGIYNIPSAELPSSEIHKRINEDCGTDFSANDVKNIYNNKLNLFFRNRKRTSETELNVEIVFDLNDESVNDDNNESENNFEFNEQDAERLNEIKNQWESYERV